VTVPFEVIRLSPLRKAIAGKMSESKRTIPHYRLSADVELDRLFQLRRALDARAPEARVSVNDLLVKTCATALMDVPSVNIQWAEEAIHQFHHADIAIVTAVDGGLLTPIVRDADVKSIWELSRELKDLLGRARTRALKMSEIMGGSFSVSNLGMYPVDEFDAIINPPQCAILAIGAARSRALVSDGREIRIASVARVTLSLDHRAIDGVTGARFLEALRERMEHPERGVGAS
jgi:pyruvate dehydrogenase E2 component (dihydrolipoamide acetyltransferase)